MELNIAYSTIKSNDDIRKTISKIRQVIDFPYKNKYIKLSKEELFNNLKKYEGNISQVKKYDIINIDKFKSNLIDSKFKNDYYQFINDDEKNYETINILSDYFSEKCRVKCKRYDMQKSPYDNFKNDGYLFNLIRDLVNKHQDINWINLRESIYKRGECANFKLTLALSVYRYFNAKRILDSSSGYSDRLIAAIAYADHLDYYHGFDPSECMKDYYQKTIDILANDKSKFNVESIPFENAKLKKTYNLIFTSPPFFALEVYNNDATQSINQYSDKIEWFCHMLIRWLIIAWRKLEINGYMVINIEDTIKTFGEYKRMDLYVEAMILFVSGYFKSAKYLGVIGHTNVGKSVVRPLWVWQKIDKGQLLEDDIKLYKQSKHKFRKHFKKYYKEEYICVETQYLSK